MALITSILAVIHAFLVLSILSAASSIESERMAIKQSGWWRFYSNDTSNHCEWRGITCNDNGSVTEISLHEDPDLGGKLDNVSFSSLPNLVNLSITGNVLYGSIPAEIGSLSKLTSLDFSFNLIDGFILAEIGSLSKLTSLNFSNNDLSGELPRSIGNLKLLENVDIGHNSFIGSIPLEIRSLSKLTSLDFSFNLINGSIPVEIRSLSKLTFLDFSNNYLSGELPRSLGNLKKLKNLNLGHNKLGGNIPSEVGNLKNLSFLNLGTNYYVGSIPFSLFGLTNLNWLDLSNNGLNRSIPIEIANLKSLQYLSLSNNKLTGVIPIEIANLEILQYLSLSDNRLTGAIPTKIGNCSRLEELYWSYNNLNGSIPAQLGEIVSLDMLDLSHNFLSGAIPFEMSRFSYWNLCCNNLTDTIVGPSSVRSKIFICLKLLPIIVFLSLLVGFVYVYRLKYKNKKTEPDATNNGDLFSIWNFDGNIAFEDIIKATEDFDIKYCIGAGGYGSVYKAVLPSGKVVALKKLHRLEAEQPAFDRSFRNEIKILTEIRHKNIVKLYGFCLHNRCMFLIYNYLEKGSLFCALRFDDEAVKLDWTKRVNIVKDVAHALCHGLHPTARYCSLWPIGPHDFVFFLKRRLTVEEWCEHLYTGPNSSTQPMWDSWLPSGTMTSSPTHLRAHCPQWHTASTPRAGSDTNCHGPHPTARYCPLWPIGPHSFVFFLKRRLTVEEWCEHLYTRPNSSTQPM